MSNIVGKTRLIGLAILLASAHGLVPQQQPEQSTRRDFFAKSMAAVASAPLIFQNPEPSFAATNNPKDCYTDCYKSTLCFEEKGTYFEHCENRFTLTNRFLFQTADKLYRRIQQTIVRNSAVIIVRKKTGRMVSVDPSRQLEEKRVFLEEPLELELWSKERTSHQVLPFLGSTLVTERAKN